MKEKETNKRKGKSGRKEKSAMHQSFLEDLINSYRKVYRRGEKKEMI